MIGLGLARLLALGICAVGGAAIVLPRTSSLVYGFATDDPNALAFVRAAGARDVALGLLVIATARLKSRDAVTAAVGACMIAAAADLCIVAGSRPPPPGLALHAAGVVALGITHALLHAGR